MTVKSMTTTSRKPQLVKTCCYVVKYDGGPGRAFGYRFVDAGTARQAVVLARRGIAFFPGYRRVKILSVQRIQPQPRRSL